jgi:hypothetical protein
MIRRASTAISPPQFLYAARYGGGGQRGVEATWDHLGPAAGTQNGACRLTCKGDKGRSGLHIDPATYCGIHYLSRPEDCARADAGGTDFFRHKRRGLEAVL